MTQWKSLIWPLLSLVFVSGGAWVTLEAVAQQTEELEDRVVVVEDAVGAQQVQEVKIQQIEDRLRRLENMVEKLATEQQRALANQAAICQATGANWR